MKVCIALNGIVNDYNKTKEIIEKENYDYIIGADGGICGANFPFG